MTPEERQRAFRLGVEDEWNGAPFMPGSTDEYAVDAYESGRESVRRELATLRRAREAKVPA